MQLTTALSILAGTAITLAPVSLGEPDAEMPITRIAMFRSGVAAYERFGRIEDDRTLRLLFAEEALDDVLKSLVVIDGDGGRVGSVNYSVSEPLERRLAALGLSAGDLSMDGLLRALRGVRISYSTGGPARSAVVLGLTERIAPGPEGGFSQRFVSLMDGARIEAVPVSAIASFEIEDAALREEFAGVIAELNRQRGELQKAVEVSLEGDGIRRVRAMYVAPSPVWKTTYRLVLGEGSSTLVGWAIVENTSDQDWDDVELSLISGRPVGFTMPVSDPVFAARPTLDVPIELALGARVFEAGREAKFARRGDRGRGVAASPMMEAEMMADSFDSGGRAGGESLAFSGANMGRSLSIATSSGDAGELFVYTIDSPVSVGRQSSAMIPIISSPVGSDRVSILSTSDGKHPMRGVRLTNSSDLELLAGPITVFDEGMYQGDAMIDRVARDDERLLAFAQDLDLIVDRSGIDTSRTTTIKIVNGTYIATRLIKKGTTYTLTNKDTRRERRLVLEHPKLGGWELEADADPREEAGGVYRFDVDIKKGKSREFTVRQSRVEDQRVSMLSMSTATAVNYSRNGRLPKAVREAMETFADKRYEIERAERRLETLEGEVREIDRDQSRIRSNMGALDRQSDLYRRYVNTLTEGEDRLAVLRTKIDEQRARVETLKSSLDAWVRTLKVG